MLFTACASRILGTARTSVQEAPVREGGTLAGGRGSQHQASQDRGEPSLGTALLETHPHYLITAVEEHRFTTKLEVQP